MIAWTDYPIEALGDESRKEAPVRQIEVLSYDGDKYLHCRVEGQYLDIKAGYVYLAPGRCGDAPPVTRAWVDLLPVVPFPWDAPKRSR